MSPERSSDGGSPDDPSIDAAAVRAFLGEMTRVIAGWVLILAGAAALVVGWFGVSREALVARQIPYLLSGGLGGLGAVIVGAVLVGSHDVRRTGDRLDTLETRVAELHEVLLIETEADTTGGSQEDRSQEAPVAASSDGQVVVLPDGERFHDPGCAVVNGKAGVERLDADDARARDLEPCKLCEPAGHGTPT